MASLSLMAGAALPGAFAQHKVEETGETFSPDNISLLDGVSMRTFEPFVGQRFAVSSPGRSLGSLILLSVRAASPVPPASGLRMVGRVPQPRQEPQPTLTGFSLHFQGSGGTLAQNTYTFRNTGLGNFPLFIVPAGPGVTPPTYTATFNFLTPPRRG